MVERLLGRAFYRLLQLDVCLGSIHDLAPTGDVIFHQMFVQQVGDSQPVDECESRHILVAVVYFGQLTLKVANVRLETARGSH